MDTLLLDENWDLKVDVSGNIAKATGPYAIAQDVASAMRTFRGEPWYDTTLGVPYFDSILGELPAQGFLIAKFSDAALTVPEVAKIRCEIDSLGADRRLTGKVHITDTRGRQTTQIAFFSPALPWYINAARTW